jgi:membrane-bound lytic murein transglycosylase D
VHLRYNFFPPSKKEYTLYIPYDKIAEFKNSYDPSKSNNQFLVHVVQKGDSLYAIGKKYNMPYSVIKDFNNLKSNFLSLNQKLIIPKIGKANIKMPKSKRNYTIKSGDTLSEISRKFGIEIKKLMQANNMANYFIKKGDTLVIPYN